MGDWYREMSFFIAVMLAPIMIACSPQQDPAADETAQAEVRVSPGSRPAAAPTPAELAGMRYTGIYAEGVMLQDGRWEGEPFVEGGASRPVVGMVQDFTLTGDLDNDGVDEAVAILWESSGGSGTNSYVAVAGRRDGQLANVGTALIGDRVQLRDARIIDGRVELDVVQQGPDDAACCPTETATRVWVLADEGLSEIDASHKGTLSLLDLQGQEWLLVSLGRDVPVPDSLEATLTFSADGVAGHSGCNRYFGAANPGKQPGEMSLGPLAGTRMACPPTAMDFETRYLQMLAGVMRYGFLNGRLALTVQQDDSVSVLLFSPRDL
jgi:heat shock protein HslJ